MIARAAAARTAIFLGMAAGVGKTYRMLLEGQAEAESGRDVVIGYLEPHGRRETEELARDLEVVPRRRVPYRETTVEEMDLPAILARAPELCLIDELAHTNAVGVEHEKRWQDVESVVEAGIDVFSTVNVQHLESLNDQVAELTGTRVRETIPDSVLGRRRRGRPDRHHAAGADRAPARRQDLHARPDRGGAQQLLPRSRTSRRCARCRCARSPRRSRPSGSSHPGPLREDLLVQTAAPQAVGERLLALITLSPQSQRVVRRAWRSAQRLGAELDLLWIVKPGRARAGRGQAPSSPPCAGSRRCSARTSSSRRASR